MSLKKYTYEDYYNLDDDKRYELIDGVIYLMATPSRQHQEILWNLTVLVGSYLRGKPCKPYAAPFDVRLPLAGEDAKKPHNVVQPDLVVVCDGSKLDSAGCVGAPDLVVEILSLSTASTDMLIKRDLYEKAGVLEYWIVDPVKHQVNILRLENGKFGETIVIDEDKLLTTTILPDLELDLKEVFVE